MSEEIVKIKDVWKTYKMGEVNVHALRGVNLTIKKGEFLSVTGPSGSGKSTFMNMIGCLDTPSKGSVYLSNKNISEMSESDLASIRGKKIGFIFQQFNLIPSLTAQENVMLPMLFQKEDEQERKKRSKKYLKMVGLGDRLHHKPNQLSGGQQQRVAIARSLSNEPEMILADEPTGNLDTKSGKVIMEFLKKINKENNTTIVMVTHDEKVAKQARKRIYLKDGFIVENLDENTQKMIKEANT